MKGKIVDSSEEVKPNTRYQINEIVVVSLSKECPKGIKFESLGSSDAKGIIDYFLAEDDSMVGYELSKIKRRKKVK